MPGFCEINDFEDEDSFNLGDDGDLVPESNGEDANIHDEISGSIANVGNGDVKGKKRVRRKPVGKPKRPLSAYNIFFQLERDRIVNGDDIREFTAEDVSKVRIVPVDKMPKRRDRKTHGKIAFSDLARSIGFRWKQLSDDAKKVFEERAKIEKARYEIEVSLWNQNQSMKKIGALQQAALASNLLSDKKSSGNDKDDNYSGFTNQSPITTTVCSSDINEVSPNPVVIENQTCDSLDSYDFRDVSNFNHDSMNSNSAYPSAAALPYFDNRHGNSTYSSDASAVMNQAYKKAMLTYNMAKTSLQGRRISLDNSESQYHLARRQYQKQQQQLLASSMNGLDSLSNISSLPYPSIRPDASTNRSTSLSNLLEESRSRGMQLSAHDPTLMASRSQWNDDSLRNMNMLSNSRMGDLGMSWNAQLRHNNHFGLSPQDSILCSNNSFSPEFDDEDDCSDDEDYLNYHPMVSNALLQQSMGYALPSSQFYDMGDQLDYENGLYEDNNEYLPYY